MSAVQQLPQNAIVRGPSTLLASSRRLNWKGIVVEHHIANPGEREEIACSSPIIELASSKHVARGERADLGGKYRPYIKQPGSIYLFAEGYLPRLRPSTPTELIACALDPVYVEAVAAEQNSLFRTKLRNRISIQDHACSALMRLLTDEAKSGGASGRLYTDHLVYALTLRLHFLDRNPPKWNATPTLALSRVFERMEDDISEDLDLETLAAVSGYSRNHFLRLFHAATGSTPYQYLQNLRVEKAKVLMKNRSLRLLDVALACGYSSDAQLTRVFHRVTGVSAGKYRRFIL